MLMHPTPSNTDTKSSLGDVAIREKNRMGDVGRSDDPPIVENSFASSHFLDFPHTIMTPLNAIIDILVAPPSFERKLNRLPFVFTQLELAWLRFMKKARAYAYAYAHVIATFATSWNMTLK